MGRAKAPLPKARTPDLAKALRTWRDLNAAVKEADLKRCEELLQAELAGQRRKGFLHRIHARLNKVRAHREREAYLR